MSEQGTARISLYTFCALVRGGRQEYGGIDQSIEHTLDDHGVVDSDEREFFRCEAYATIKREPRECSIPHTPDGLLRYVVIAVRCGASLQEGMDMVRRQYGIANRSAESDDLYARAKNVFRPRLMAKLEYAHKFNPCVDRCASH